MQRIITVFAADSQRAMEVDGAAIEMDFDFVAQAKQYAQYLVTDAYRRASESSTCLGYSQVVVNGIVTYDFFAQPEKCQWFLRCTSRATGTLPQEDK